MTKKTSINWEKFSINSLEFIKAEREDNLSQLLHEYFSKNVVVNQQFIAELAEKHPELLIRSIRVNRAFLRKKHVDSLKFLQNHSNNYLKNHFLVFTELSKREEEYFNDFKTALQKTDSLDVLETLVWVSFWFEEKRADLFNSQRAHIFHYDVSEFTETINFFLSYYLFENKEKINTTVFQKENDFKELENIIPVAVQAKDIKTNPVWECLDMARMYLYYMKGTLEVYSFDMNYEVEVLDRMAELKYIDANKLKRWHVENAKLGFWYDYHRAIATELVLNEAASNPNFIPDKTGLDYEMNIEGAIRTTISEKIAHDYCVNESRGGVPSSSLLKTLQGFAINALGRYVFPMDKLNHRNPKEWLKNIALNAAHFAKQQIAAVPTRFIDNESLIQTITNNIEPGATYTENLISLITNDINNYGYIDKFHPPINLMGKPFIKLNDFYFAFNGILGETSLQINILVNAMESNAKAHSIVTKSETEKLEKKIQTLFYKTGFIQSDCSIKYFDGDIPVGDFDIIVYEKGIMLLIELKRSKPRVHLSDAHDEYENSLVTASKQLDKAYKYISSNFDTCKKEYLKKLNITETEFSKIKFYPLIVSTSFENDHILIKDKHLKISLFELQNILENGIELVSGNKLESLINKIIRNEYWEFMEAGIKLPLTEGFVLKFPV